MGAIDDLKLDPQPPRQAAAFTALVFVQDHPGKLNHAKLEKQKPKGKGGKGASTTEVVEVYKGGFTPSIHIRTAKHHVKWLRLNGKWENLQIIKKLKVQCILKLGIKLKLYFIQNYHYLFLHLMNVNLW